MNIRISDTGGYNIHVDTSEKWLLFKALDALMSSNSIDSYEERLVRDMMNEFREDRMNSSKQIKSDVGENKAKMLAKMAKEMHWTNNPEYRRFMNDLNRKVGVYRSIVDLAYDEDIKEYLDFGDDEYFKSCVETELKKICSWEFDRDFVWRMKRYSPKAWDDIVEKSVQLVKDNLK